MNHSRHTLEFAVGVPLLVVGLALAATDDAKCLGPNVAAAHGADDTHTWTFLDGDDTDDDGTLLSPFISALHRREALP